MPGGQGSRERRELRGRRPWNNPGVRDLFVELTGEQSASAVRARVIIVQWRRTHGESPTWQELFAELAGQDEVSDERRAKAWTDRWLRNYTLIHWRRNHWIYFTKHHRSLRLQPSPKRAREHSGSAHRGAVPRDDEDEASVGRKVSPSPSVDGAGPAEEAEADHPV